MSFHTQVITFTNDNGVAFTDVEAAEAALTAIGGNAVTGPLFHSLQDDGCMHSDQAIDGGSYVCTWVMDEVAAPQIAAAPQLTFPGVTVVYGAVGSVDTHAILDDHHEPEAPGLETLDSSEAVEDIEPGVHGVDPEPEPPAPGGDSGWEKPGAHLNEDGSWSDEPA